MIRSVGGYGAILVINVTVCGLYYHHSTMCLSYCTSLLFDKKLELFIAASSVTVLTLLRAY